MTILAYRIGSVGRALGICLGLVAGLNLTVRAADAPAAAPPAAGSASAPVAMPAASSVATSPGPLLSEEDMPARRAIEPLGPAKSVEQGLRYDADENTILSAVRDHTRQLTESGLYVLLRRAACLPELDYDQFTGLDRISVSSMMNSPAKVRGLPTYMIMRVYESRKWSPGVQFRFSERWPRDRPVWWMGGLEGTGHTKGPRRVVVLSVVDPSRALGVEDRVGKDGELIYNSGRLIELAGIFYKTYSDRRADDTSTAPKLEDFPVVIAWQVERSGSIFGHFERNWHWWVILGGVSALIVATFVYFSRRLSRGLKGGVQPGRFQSFRRLRLDRESADVPAGEPGEAVDPKLRAAAEEFRKEKRP